MPPSETLLSLVTQTLLRGAGWLLLLLLAAPLLRQTSAAHRAVFWQMGIVGLILLPLCFFALPPLAVPPAIRPTAVTQEPRVPLPIAGR